MSAAESWFQQLDEGVVLIHDGRVVDLNAAAARLLGVERERVVGLPMIAALRDHRLERAVLEGAALELETRGRTLTARPFDGGLLLRDVSELRRAQEDARRLLAVLSHELRTPVTTIHSTLEALDYELPAATRARFLERARSECGRLGRLLEDLTVDVRPPAARSLSLRDTVARAAGILQPTLARRRVQLRCELPDLTVWADPDKLLQVILNLVENAALHGPTDASVEVRAAPVPVPKPPAAAGTAAPRASAVRAAEPVAPDARWAHLRVRDHGAPLDPAAVEALFTPHGRGNSHAPGSGLGLYIVRSIAERWGGEAWGAPWRRGAESGNEFGVTVPLAGASRSQRP